MTIECPLCGSWKDDNDAYCGQCHYDYELDMEAGAYPTTVDAKGKSVELTEDGKNCYSYYDWRKIEIIRKEAKDNHMSLDEARREKAKVVIAVNKRGAKNKERNDRARMLAEREKKRNSYPV